MNTTTTTEFDSLLEKIKNKSLTVGIVGLGYVGLPLIDAFYRAGCKCLGFDVDPNKIESLNAGKSYIEHIPSETIQKWRDEEMMEATADFGQLAKADAILICVPTPLSESRDPDLKYVEATAEAIQKTLRAGQLVVLESTTYPGTTKDVILPILEKSGLKVEEDFFLAYSPEREDPGNAQFAARNIPKVVGGHGPKSVKLAADLYGHAVSEVVPVNSCEVAEACKILENT